MTNVNPAGHYPASNLSSSSDKIASVDSETREINNLVVSERSVKAMLAELSAFGIVMQIATAQLELKWAVYEKHPGEKQSAALQQALSNAEALLKLFRPPIESSLTTIVVATERVFPPQGVQSGPGTGLTPSQRTASQANTGSTATGKLS